MYGLLSALFGAIIGLKVMKEFIFHQTKLIREANYPWLPYSAELSRTIYSSLRSGACLLALFDQFDNIEVLH